MIAAISDLFFSDRSDSSDYMETRLKGKWGGGGWGVEVGVV